MAKRNRTAYWGTCDDCLTGVVIYSHVDAEEDLPEYDYWEHSYVQCPVCDSDIQFAGSDPAEDIRL